MKVLLDENLDHRLRSHLQPHDVFTVSFMGWSGLKNGTLLRAAEDAGFEVFLTGDQTLSHEQNLAERRLAIISLSSIEWRILRDHLPRIAEAIDHAVPGICQAVDCGRFDRGKTGKAWKSTEPTPVEPCATTSLILSV